MEYNRDQTIPQDMMCAKNRMIRLHETEQANASALCSGGCISGNTISFPAYSSVGRAWLTSSIFNRPFHPALNRLPPGKKSLAGLWLFVKNRPTRLGERNMLRYLLRRTRAGPPLAGRLLAYRVQRLCVGLCTNGAGNIL